MARCEMCYYAPLKKWFGGSSNDTNTTPQEPETTQKASKQSSPKAKSQVDVDKASKVLSSSIDKDKNNKIQ